MHFLLLNMLMLGSPVLNIKGTLEQPLSQPNTTAPNKTASLLAHSSASCRVEAHRGAFDAGDSFKIRAVELSRCISFGDKISILRVRTDVYHASVVSVDLTS